MTCAYPTLRCASLESYNGSTAWWAAHRRGRIKPCKRFRLVLQNAGNRVAPHAGAADHAAIGAVQDAAAPSVTGRAVA